MNGVCGETDFNVVATLIVCTRDEIKVIFHHVCAWCVVLVLIRFKFALSQKRAKRPTRGLRFFTCSVRFFTCSIQAPCGSAAAGGRFSGTFS
jgi:hypothetical protein